MSNESICTISLQKKDGALEASEAEALTNDFLFFLEPYLTEFLLRPSTSYKNPDIFQTSFHCYKAMQETIEAFIYKTMDFSETFRVTLTFDSIEAPLRIKDETDCSAVEE